MSLALSLEQGGRATVVETSGERIVLESDVPAPPGSLLAGTLPGEPRPFRVKVRSCRRVDSGDAFRIEGRLVDLTRRQRERLAVE